MPIDPETLSDAGLQNLIANYRKQNKSDETYLRALAEHAKRRGRGLDFDTTLKVITAAAREGRFLSYGELAEASGADWGQVHYSVGGHLGDLIEYCHRNGMPLLSAIVVNKPNIKTGKMEPDTLRGFVSGARAVGIAVTDDEAFLREQQQKVFDWARSEKS